jgi:CHAT domain-containing protein
MSVPVRYSACCASKVSPLGPEFGRLAGRISSAAESGVDPDALQAAAVIDLMAGGAEKTLDRSISYLEMATRLIPTADRYVDLSAAYLTRAGRDGDAAATVAALDAAARAAARDSTDPAARFNMALALRELGLFGAAEAQFDRFIALTGGSPWTDEAKSYRFAVAIDTVVMPSVASLTPPEMTRFATEHPAEARQMAWERLAAWGRATQSGDTARAKRELALAQAAGYGIDSVQDDASISDAVSSIHRAALPARLADAHVAFITAQQLWQANRNAGAETAYLEAQRKSVESPSLHAWALHGYGNNRLGFQDLTRTEMVMRQLLEGPTGARYPALAARSLWTLGVTLLRLRRFDHGVAVIARSRALYEKLGEPESEGWMTAELGEAAGLGGDARVAYTYYAQALRTMREYPLSTWRHNVLLLLSRAATADGYTAAAAVIDAENETADRAAVRLPQLAEDQVTRARAALPTGDRATATAAISEGRRVVSQIPESGQRFQLEADIGITEVELEPDRPDARQLLDSAVSYLSTINNFSKQLRAYAARAAWLVREGNDVAAAKDFDAALTIYEQRRDSASDPALKALLVEQGWTIVDGLTKIHLRHGEPRRALAARERGRVKMATDAPLPNTVGPVIELAVLDDTLVTFVTKGSQTSAFRAAIDSAQLTQDVELVLAALERGAPAAVSQPVLERLYDMMIRPVSGEISASDSMVTIVTTPALGRIPFAALRDAKTGRYLIERYALRFARSLQQASAAPTPLPARARSYVVANPDVDRRVFPGLAPLPAVASEVEGIVALLNQPTIMVGPDVDTIRVKRAMRSAELMHFAGHALFDDAQPQKSQLVIGARGITAKSIATMRLPNLRLVVLSACETARSPVGAGAGFLGLTESFAAAGAGGVVGSLWKVGDAATSQLMNAFYESLPRMDPATALQAAQRSMLSMGPGAWAGFRYVGN